MIKDLVVIVVARSAWLWVCKSDLVMSGDGFTNWFLPWVWGCISVVDRGGIGVVGHGLWWHGGFGDELVGSGGSALLLMVEQWVCLMGQVDRHVLLIVDQWVFFWGGGG